MAYIENIPFTMLGPLQALLDLEAADFAVLEAAMVFTEGAIGSITLEDLADVNITSPTNMQVLAYDSATGEWTNQTISSGGGTVTSFSSGALSPLFTTSVATATTTPALSFSLDTQNENLVFAGPSNGSAAGPTFRSLVVADLPTSGSWAFAGTISGNLTFSGNPEFSGELLDGTGSPGTSGYVLTSQGSGNYPKWEAASGGAPGGSSGDIQYNNSGSFGGSAVTITSAGVMTIPAGGSLTIQDTAANDDLILQNTTTATSGTINASPLLEFEANYWTGSASAADTWAIGSSLASGTNGTSLLTVTHSGSSGTAIFNLASGESYGINGSTVLTLPDSDTTSIAVGIGAAATQNSTNSNNTAIGYQAMNQIAAGYDNVAVGYRALYTNLGTYANVAVGDRALYSENYGYNNTAVGFECLYNTSSGYNNTAVGLGAGISNFTGYNLTFLGANTNVSVDGLTNATAVGSSVTITTSNTIVIGNSSVTDVYFGSATPAANIHGVVYYASGSAGVTQTAEAVGTLATTGGIVTAFTAVSDERLKNFVLYEGGLDEILEITPIRYRWNEKGQELSGQRGDRDYVGFSANNVQKVIPESIQSKKGPEEYLSFDDRPVIAALVNAVKELCDRIRILEAKYESA